MASPDCRLVNGTVENLTANDGTRQDEEEGNGFGRGRGVASCHVAVEVNLDAGGVHEDGGDEVVTYFRRVSCRSRRPGKRNLLNERLPMALHALLDRMRLVVSLNSMRSKMPTMTNQSSMRG